LGKNAETSVRCRSANPAIHTTTADRTATEKRYNANVHGGRETDRETATAAIQAISDRPTTI
jgi:hypothetical protein